MDKLTNMRTLFAFAFLISLVLGEKAKLQMVLTATGKHAGYFRENILYGASDRGPVSVVCSTTDAHVFPVFTRGSSKNPGKPLCGKDAVDQPGIRCESTEGIATLTFEVFNKDMLKNYTCLPEHKSHRDDVDAADLSVFLKDDRINVSESIGPQLPKDSFTVFCLPKKSALNELSADAFDPKPRWYYNGKALDPGSNGRISFSEDHQSITVDTPGRRDSGVYMCAFRVQKNGFVHWRSYTDVFSAPYIFDEKKASTNAMEGHSANLHCKAYGHPVPLLSWSKKLDGVSTTIPYPDDEGHFIYSSYNGLSNGTLTIKSLGFDDRAEYICHAENRYNSTEHGSMLRVKGKLAALWPFLGIVAEVIILVLVIFLYERHQKKKQAREDETDDLAEQKQALTQSQDLRQRKGEVQ